MTYVYSKSKTARTPLHEHIDDQMDWLSLLIPVDDLKVLRTHAENNRDWGDDAAVLMRALASSTTGQRMFGHASTSVVVHEAETLMAKHMDRWLDAGDTSKASYNAMIGTFITEARSLDSITHLPSKRNVSFIYRGIRFQVRASSSKDHAEFFMTRIREYGLRSGDLYGLLAESELVHDLLPAPAGDLKFDE